MKRTQEEIEQLHNELWAKGWDRQELNDMTCECGAFGIEDCAPDCPIHIALQNDPVFIAQCLAEECYAAEIKAGWDPTP